MLLSLSYVNLTVITVKNIVKHNHKIMARTERFKPSDKQKADKKKNNFSKSSKKKEKIQLRESYKGYNY